MRKLCVLVVTLMLALSCTSCGQKLDFTEEDRTYVAYSPDTLGSSSVGPLGLDTCIGLAATVFVGSVKDIEHIVLTSEEDSDFTIEYNLFTVQVDDLWFGEVVGGEVVLNSSTIYYNDDIFINHRDSQYVFMLSPATPNNPVDERFYLATKGFYSIIPIQPSTGKMYPLYTALPEYQQLEGQPPEYLKDLIAAEQQDILENGYDDENGERLCVDNLDDVLMPYQVAYETGKPVYLEPRVITWLKEGALSQYKDKPYYDELVELTTEEYESRKNKRGLRESELLETLESKLPEMAEKAERAALEQKVTE